MIASEFRPRPEPEYGTVSRLLLQGMFYGLGWPLSRALIPFGKWPPLPHMEKRIRDVQMIEPTSSDVFAASFFKSGTTWLMNVITQIAFRGQAEFERIHHVVPWVEMPAGFDGRWIAVADPSPARLSPTGLRCVKSHLPWELIPRSPEAKYVAMVRDPKAVAVSGYHFIKALSLGATMPPFRNWVDKFCSPEFFEGNWSQHLAGYWARRDEPNMLFLNYDDLRGDLDAGVDRISAFMGVELTPEERAAVIERTCFATMKREGRKFDPPRPMPWSRDESMVRTGGSGSSDSLMTPQIARRIDDYFRADLLRLGCDFDYDAAFCREG